MGLRRAGFESSFLVLARNADRAAGIPAALVLCLTPPPPAKVEQNGSSCSIPFWELNKRAVVVRFCLVWRLSGCLPRSVVRPAGASVGRGAARPWRGVPGASPVCARFGASPPPSRSRPSRATAPGSLRAGAPPSAYARPPPGGALRLRRARSFNFRSSRISAIA